uniref:WD_REPEATS_REGION domain-containing protein n=1 Tax=Syphacia muris TaxID=451379 RepID=A0A0N5AP31_9BILA
TWYYFKGGVLSIDFHPSGLRLATCGSSNEQSSSGLAVIWYVKPIISENDRRDQNCPRILYQVPFKSCVSCVRWSTNGQYLACGGDDKYVMILEGSYRAEDHIHEESYCERFRLEGHTGDILHFEWSRDGRYLASCGLDHFVIIWDAHKLPEKVVLLDASRGGHTAPIKGLSWDPSTRFLATQAADRSLRIWCVKKWQCVEVINDPFLESYQTTLFCRMDWSADGDYLLVPCAKSATTGFTVQLIRRNDWDTSQHLVYHRNSVTAVRACSKSVQYKDYEDNTHKATCFAVGSRDKGISIWLIPDYNRPVRVLDDIFKHSVMDFSWHDYHLLACSMDGSIRSILFTEEDIGRILLSNNEVLIIC